VDCVEDQYGFTLSIFAINCCIYYSGLHFIDPCSFVFTLSMYEIQNIEI
jgi:hypothetical protein